jgi:hypothetical protein
MWFWYIEGMMGLGELGSWGLNGEGGEDGRRRRLFRLGGFLRVEIVGMRWKIH